MPQVDLLTFLPIVFGAFIIYTTGCLRPISLKIMKIAKVHFMPLLLVMLVLSVFTVTFGNENVLFGLLFSKHFEQIRSFFRSLKGHYCLDGLMAYVLVPLFLIYGVYSPRCHLVLSFTEVRLAYFGWLIFIIVLVFSYFQFSWYTDYNKEPSALFILAGLLVLLPSIGCVLFLLVKVWLFNSHLIDLTYNPVLYENSIGKVSIHHTAEEFRMICEAWTSQIYGEKSFELFWSNFFDVEKANAVRARSGHVGEQFICGLQKAFDNKDYALIQTYLDRGLVLVSEAK